MCDLGLSDDAWSGSEMRPRRAMNEERMANIHVAGAASCPCARALKGRGRQQCRHVPGEHTWGAEWREHARDIEVRSYQDLRWCVRRADVREEEQRQESAVATVHV